MGIFAMVRMSLWVLASALVLSGCATTMHPGQIAGVSIPGLDQSTREQCLKDIISKRINTETWRVVSTSKILHAEMSGPKDTSFAALRGEKPTIDRRKLRFVRVTIRGQGNFGEATHEAVCILEAQGASMRFIQSCDLSGGNKMYYCPLKFIQG